MPRALACALLAAVAGLTLAACGGTSDETPVACLDGPGAYLGALGDAPGKVRLSGEVAIGDCLAKNQKGGDLATVGAALVAAATRLNAVGRRPAGAESALQLGYLVGAARDGAEDTAGIHSDLLRRLEAAATYSPGGEPLPPSFRRAYRKGLAAGESGG